jgi:hypothetical protein
LNEISRSTATSMKAIPPSSLIEIYRRFRCAVRNSETSVYFNDIVRHYIPEGCHLQELLFFTFHFTCEITAVRDRMSTFYKLKLVDFEIAVIIGLFTVAPLMNGRIKAVR